MNERLLLALPHRQFIFTFPKLLRPYFRHNRRLFAEVSQLSFAILQRFYDKAAKRPVRTGMVLASQTSGEFFTGKTETFQLMRFFLELTPHIPPKGCTYIRRYGLYVSRTKGKWPRSRLMGCGCDADPRGDHRTAGGPQDPAPSGENPPLAPWGSTHRRPTSNLSPCRLPGSHSARPACAAILRGAHFSTGDMLWIGGSAAVMDFDRRKAWMARNRLDRYGF